MYDFHTFCIIKFKDIVLLYKMSLLCEICGYKSTTKYNLLKHQKTESCQRIKLNNELNNKINELTRVNIEFNNKISKLIKELENRDNILLNKNTEIKLLQDKYEDLRKIVEKAATKSTKTIKNNYNHNNYLNYISTEPLKISEIPKQLKSIVNCDTVMYDEDDFHDHIVDNILKDKSGKDKVLCTDINRKNFTYKDEKSGELISDPELEILRDKLKKGTNIRQIRKDLLDKLVTEYEDNGSIGTDPYKQFSDIIQKLNFGSPFVDHVAKKTYIKSKSNIEENEIARITELSENENLEYDEPLCGESFDEEEYKKLLEEFGNEV